MKNQYVFLSFLFISFLDLFFSLPSDKIWKKTLSYIEQGKMVITENKTHFVFDESNYTKLDINSSHMKYLYKKQENLFKKYNVSNYIFLIDNLDEKEEIIEEVTFNLCRYLRNIFKIDMEQSIVAVFSIGTRKFRIRIGAKLKNKIISKDLRELSSNLYPFLKWKRYYRVLIRYYDYINNYLYIDQNGLKIIFILIFLYIFFIIIGKFCKNNLCRKKVILLRNINNAIKKDKNLKKIVNFFKKQKTNKKILMDNCSICLEEFNFNEVSIKNGKNENILDQEKKVNLEKDISLLECGHQFHEECINEWMKKKKECPLCRQKINKKYNEDDAEMIWGVQNEINNNIYEQYDLNDLIISDYPSIFFNFIGCTFEFLDIFSADDCSKIKIYRSSEENDYGGGITGEW